MEGIILFADDHIFDTAKLENKLFQRFNSDNRFCVFPIDNLDTLDRTVVSISTYKALILDWNFNRQIDDDEVDVRIPSDTPYDFLKSKNLYVPLVYIYSQEDIPMDTKTELQDKYNGKIIFQKKDDTAEFEVEFQKIVNDIESFEDRSKHLAVPFVWSQTINQSAQVIFSELEQADPNWIREIYNTALGDGADPNMEIIGVFQHLLNESIIQNNNLLEALTESVKLDSIAVNDKETSLAKLYNRIYFTKLNSTAPFMTGDIFQFNDDEFAILITPECDMKKKKDNALDFLIFSKGISEHFKNTKLNKDINNFNNGTQSRHILPSFPFEPDKYNLSAYIDFDKAFMVVNQSEFKDKRTIFKLNSPYIYQLRQRYLAYIGRVGVPAIPHSLKMFNIK